MKSKPITIELTCPNCGQRFEDAYAGVLHLSGMGFKADFEPGFETHGPISELLLYQCDRCGYTERSIIDRFEQPVSSEIQVFTDETLPKIQRECDEENYSTRSKFENYARYLEFNGARNFDIGKAFLRASWLNDSDTCRSLAHEYFEKAVSEKGAVGGAEAPFAAYLGAEMARKLGKFLAAERLFHVANKLSRKSPELAIRTYNFILEMSGRQTTEPTDEPIWNFSEGLILDPLDYYHAKILTTIAVYYRYTQQEDAVALYNRAFDLCRPALDRTITKKSPKIKFGQEDGYLIRELAKRSIKEGTKGFWADNCLLMMGHQSLTELKNLKSGIHDFELLEKVELASKTYAEVMVDLDRDLKNHSKGNSRSNGNSVYKGIDENKIERVWNSVIFVLLAIMASLAASVSTYYGLKAFGVVKNLLMIFLGTSAAWFIFSVGQSLLKSFSRLIARLLKNKLDQNPVVNFIISFLVLIGGLVLSIILAGWPVIISSIIAGGFLVGLNLIIQRVKKRRQS